MAAYAALVSLTTILHDIQNHHSPPISIDEKLLQSLTQSLTSLLEFIEHSESPVADDDDEADPFEMRIVDAAYAAEDVIESHLVDAIRTHHQQAVEDVIESHSNGILHQQTSSISEDDLAKSNNFYQDLQRVINELDLINLIPWNPSKKKVVEALQSMPYARSVIFESGEIPACQNFRLLRTFHEYKFPTKSYMNSVASRHVNLRHLLRTKSYMNSAASRYLNLRHLAVEVLNKSLIFSSLNLFWNLRTLIVSCPDYDKSIMPAEIWKMPQLRHIEFLRSRVCLPDPPPSEKDEDVVIIENLHVIKGVKNFKCSKDLVKRIPNLKILETQYLKPKLMSYDDPLTTQTAIAEAYYVSNIQYLSKLEHLCITCDRDSRVALYLLNITFPQSLKKLSFSMDIEFGWEEILERIGSLPRLEKLRLWNGCFKSGKWEMVRGQFPELKYLGLFHVNGLKQWTVEDSMVLPRLEKLDLLGVRELEEIPSEIGYIETLQKVELQECSESMVRSARAMVDEQVYEQGTDELPFHV